MSPADIAFAVFIAMAILSAAIWHKFVRVGPFAVIGATVTTVVTYQVLGWLIDNTPEKFIVIAYIVSSIYALGISIAVGIPYWVVRRRKGERAHAP